MLRARVDVESEIRQLLGAVTSWTQADGVRTERDRGGVIIGRTMQDLEMHGIFRHLPGITRDMPDYSSDQHNHTQSGRVSQLGFTGVIVPES
jgi:hypothetical protein